MSEKKLKLVKGSEQVVEQLSDREHPTKQELAPELAPIAPTHFSITIAGVNELAEAIHDTVKSIHVKNVLFNVINTHLKPL